VCRELKEDFDALSQEKQNEVGKKENIFYLSLLNEGIHIVFIAMKPGDC
jgi:hypothetical protein